MKQAMKTVKARALKKLLLAATASSLSFFFLKIEVFAESCPPGYHPGNMHGKRVCKQINGPGYLPLGACPTPPPPSTETSTETSTKDPKKDNTTDPEIPQTVEEQQALNNRDSNHVNGKLIAAAFLFSALRDEILRDELPGKEEREQLEEARRERERLREKKYIKAPLLNLLKIDVDRDMSTVVDDLQHIVVEA